MELVLDSHRVVGEILCGPARRPVDIMNAIAGESALVYNAQVDDPFSDGDIARRFDVIHVHRHAILFAVPRGEAPALQATTPFDAVRKVPVPATILLPGFEISGNVFLVPEVDPIQVPLLANRNFIPVTEATVVASYGRSRTWREPVVIVNLGRAMVFAPKGPARA